MSSGGKVTSFTLVNNNLQYVMIAGSQISASRWAAIFVVISCIGGVALRWWLLM